MRDLVGIRAKRANQRRFEQIVAKALAGLPDQVHAMLDNVEIVVEDEPSADQLGTVAGDEEHTLFGLYQGVPLTQRGTGYNLVLPDKISIFRGPIQRACNTPQEIAEQVRITVMHELAHHLGFDEDRLDELGLS